MVMAAGRSAPRIVSRIDTLPDGGARPLPDLRGRTVILHCRGGAWHSTLDTGAGSSTCETAPTGRRGSCGTTHQHSWEQLLFRSQLERAARESADSGAI